jgi:hypothetical protein
MQQFPGLNHHRPRAFLAAAAVFLLGGCGSTGPGGGDVDGGQVAGGGDVASGDVASGEVASGDVASGDVASGDVASGDGATIHPDDAVANSDTIGQGDGATDDTAATDALATDAGCTPVAESCNGVDDDCDGATDESTCDDGDSCTDDVCAAAAATFACTHAAAADGLACDDGSACSDPDTCSGGACVGTILSCDDGKVCNTDSCDAATGCQHVAKEGNCDDGDPCTTGDACALGACIPGSPVVCAPGSACVVVACDATSGQCKSTLLADGSGCDDGVACTEKDVCVLGSCIGAQKACDDKNPCTVDSCDANSGGCAAAPVLDNTGCDDGSLCTKNDSCSAGVCKGAVLDCDDGSPCTENLCEAATGCFGLPKAGGCDDGSACTIGDQCKDGACAAGAAKSCDDGEVCTQDSCDAASGVCGHDATAMVGKACDDASKCTLDDVCAAGSCSGGTAKDCADTQPCTVDACDAGTGICTHKSAQPGSSCSDGSLCTMSDTCDGFGICSGKAIPCDDSKSCTIDGCEPKTGACTFKSMPKGASCDDGDACTLADSCDGAGSCGSGQTKSCDDGNDCTSQSCDSKNGDCTITKLTTPCDDSDACTSGESCVTGACKAPADGDVSTWVGSSAGFLDGAAASARFSAPRGLAMREDGAVVVADTNNHRVRLVMNVAAAGNDPGGWTVTTLAGNGSAGYNNGAAKSALFSSPAAVATAAGKVYVADRNNHRLRIIAGDQVSTAFGAIAGLVEGSGEDARLNAPEGVGVAGDGTVWIADTGNHAIRRVDKDGVLRVVAGGVGAGFADGKAGGAKFSSPRGLAVDAVGVAYVADTNNHRIRRIVADGTVTTLAGSGTAGFLDGTAANARFQSPYNVTTGYAGLVVVADLSNQRIRTILGDKVSTLSGSGVAGLLEGAANVARFSSPQGVAVLPDGAVVVADTNNHRLRRIWAAAVDCDDGLGCTVDSCDTKTGCLHVPATVGGKCNDGSACTVADTCAKGGACVGTTKPCEDNNACTVDACNTDTGACSHVDSASVCEDGDKCAGPDSCQNGVCKASQLLQTWVGSGAGYVDGIGKSAKLNYPYGLDEDQTGDILIADRSNHRIRRLKPDGTVSLVAGNGSATYLNGAAEKSSFSYPSDVASRFDGSIIVADRNNHRVRVISGGQVSLLAGSGVLGFLDGAGATAKFYYPEGAAVHPTTGEVFIADTYNNRIRRISQTGTVTTFVGSGSAAYVEGVGAGASFYRPGGIDFDATGNLWVADSYNHRIRRVAPDGKTMLVAGNVNGYVDDTGATAKFYYPADVSVGSDGLVLVADRANQRIRSVTADGLVATIAGTASAGIADGPLGVGQMSNPYSVLSASSGIVIADTSNSLIRRFGTGIKTCDDFDGCTIDACDGNSGACTHAQVANCCQPIKQWWKFEQVPEIEGWTLAACKASTSYYNPTSCVDYSATTPFKGWQIWTTSIAKGKSEGALYYGDPQAKNFNFGATAGTATSPKWSVPGPGAKLEFSFYFDCETSTTYDKFYVYLLVNDVKTNVGIASLPTNGAIVYKGQANYSLTKKFHDVSLDVSAYAGKQVQLQFYFNTGDSVGNSGQGIFVDDIRFSSPCN